MVGAFCHLVNLYPHPTEIPIEDPLAVEIERCHPDKPQPHRDQSQEEERGHHAVKQHNAGPAARKELERDQNGLGRRQATLQHQWDGKEQPHADQGRGNEREHGGQTQQIEQRAKQAGEQTAKQAQHAEAYKVAEEVEHLVGTGTHPDRLLQPQHIEGAGHGGHHHRHQQAQHHGHIHLVVIPQIGQQQHIAKQDPDRRHPDNRQQQAKSGTAGLLPSLLDDPFQIKAVALVQRLLKGAANTHFITQLTIQYRKRPNQVAHYSDLVCYS